ncbi:flavoprotein [Actinopolyspora saharensis]|uniref:Flavoprotein n=1 Tax=Actinopolyspora saharensis TaxID=995062 RepID=A0A1H1DMP1_9ACTN|nr:flavoprotein [Actinopolyspora saharensis]SDQ77673.1 Flavoprotein [Actinopolyspora saharensis]
MTAGDGPVVYLVGTAAPPVRELAEPVGLLRRAGWDVCVVLTPTAADWVDGEELAEQSGRPVRVHPRMPSEQDPLPKADAVLVAPVTFNSLNKVATGVSDTLAVSLVNELLAGEVSITLAPCVKSVLRRHPAYPVNIRLLADAGVRLLDSDSLTSRGTDGLATFDWNTAITEFLRAE